MGKKGDLSPCKKSEVKVLVNAKLFSNHEISRRMKVSEASVQRIKKKIESGEELNPKRKKKNVAESLFSPQDCETTYKNNDVVSHQWQGYWTSGRGYRYDAARPVQRCLAKSLDSTAGRLVSKWRMINFYARWSSLPYSLVYQSFFGRTKYPSVGLWPGNSPDMNTTENVWELMKREVAKDVITNKTQLLERIIHVWNHHPQMQDTVQSFVLIACRAELKLSKRLKVAQQNINI
ncbi:hypothetical protein TNCV_4160381 [Trichonephila clavipes]|nr:hypothetical protein TNCV_4160381 [Trichonephila clavipes]